MVKRIPLTPLALEVLALLHERPMHPYEMQQLMRERRVDNRVKLKAGSLYHTVERLAEGKHIEVVDTQREGRRPERTVYGLTGLGRDAFADRIRHMIAIPAREYPEYPVALSGANDLDREDVIEHLEMRIINLEGEVAKSKAVIDGLIDKELPELYWIEYRYSYHQRKSELDWTKKLVGDLKTGRIPWVDCKPARLTLVNDEYRESTGEKDAI